MENRLLTGCAIHVPSAAQRTSSSQLTSFFPYSLRNSFTDLAQEALKQNKVLNDKQKPDVLAYAGGSDYSTSGSDDDVQGRRQLEAVPRPSPARHLCGRFSAPPSIGELFGTQFAALR